MHSAFYPDPVCFAALTTLQLVNHREFLDLGEEPWAHLKIEVSTSGLWKSFDVTSSGDIM